MKSLQAWQMVQPGQPMRLETVPAPALSPDETLVRVSGCGVCHTDIGFFYEGVRTVKEVPLTLGHEVAATVEACGEDRAGIVAAICGVLAERSVNILDLSTRSRPGPGGSPHYEMVISVEVPDDIESRELREALEIEADRLVIDGALMPV